MNEIDHLGIVGADPTGTQLAAMAEANGYGVHRLGSGDDQCRIGELDRFPYRLGVLCICEAGPPGLLSAVAEYLRLSAEHKPSCVLNLTPVGPVHAGRIDALVKRVDPTTTFAEVAFSGGAGAIRDSDATVFYGSRSGAPEDPVERFILGFAGRLIELQSVTEASAAKLAHHAALTLVGDATFEALEVARESGLSEDMLAEVLPPEEAGPSVVHDLVIGDEIPDVLADHLSREEMRFLGTQLMTRRFVERLKPSAFGRPAPQT